jgi:hypothetical protein
MPIGLGQNGYLTDVLARIVNGHSNRDIDQLLPSAYRKPDLKPSTKNSAYNTPPPLARSFTAFRWA